MAFDSEEGKKEILKEDFLLEFYHHFGSRKF